MHRALASARASERRASLEGEQSPWEKGTSEPRTRGKDEPDSSADEGLEVDLHVARCPLFTNEHRAANRRRRSGRSSDRTEDALQTDDGGHRSDSMAPAHGFRCGISPGGERKPTSETEAPLTDGAPSGAPRVAERGRGAIRARNSHGGPGPDREPTLSKARARGAWFHEGTGEARANEDDASRTRSLVGQDRASGFRLALGARFRAATARRRFDPEGREAKASRPAALGPAAARRPPVSARMPATTREPRRGASPDPERGATSGARMEAST